MEFHTSQEDVKLDGNSMLKSFLTLVSQDLHDKFPFISSIEVTDLDSSTREKWSHHLIFNIQTVEKEELFFTDNRQVGLYVGTLVSKIRTMREFHLANNKVFVDESVYSRNRNFRTFLSAKFGKKVVLKRGSFSSTTSASDREFFKRVWMTSLLCLISLLSRGLLCMIRRWWGLKLVAMFTEFWWCRHPILHEFAT